MINMIRTQYDKEIVKTPVTIASGTTLYIKTESERIMSDVWEMITKAFYWDPAQNVIREQWLDTKEDKVVVDADFDAILPTIEKVQYGKFLAQELDAAKDESENPAVRGREVRVIKGRDKSVKGTVGKVVVVKEMQYGMGYRSVMAPKLGIALDDVMVEVVRNGKTYTNYKNMIWVWAHNCEVVNPTPDAESAVKSALARTESYMKALQYQIANSIKTFN